ncbi:hypothetical protein C8Q80DRAFT_1104905 [Daedaleopsis nitida]|nr:hypothetical protein C8Q80DRAFT_1104905 [Daedaleopsis nitida]
MAITPKLEPKDTTLPPPPSKQHTNPEGKTDAEVQKERDKALKTLSEHRRATAWPVGRRPLERRVVWARTRVHLPRTYLAREGSDVRTVQPGTEVNALVHRHYFEAVGRDGRRIEEGAWPNYVAAERIIARRHEYLGPDPRVAGYFVDAAGEYHVKWYDAFLGDQWMDNRKWTFDLRLDARGRWVAADDPE